MPQEANYFLGVIGLLLSVIECIGTGGATLGVVHSISNKWCGIFMYANKAEGLQMLLSFKFKLYVK